MLAPACQFRVKVNHNKSSTIPKTMNQPQFITNSIISGITWARAVALFLACPTALAGDGDFQPLDAQRMMMRIRQSHVGHGGCACVLLDAGM
jgi:hypothetical protein